MFINLFYFLYIYISVGIRFGLRSSTIKKLKHTKYTLWQHRFVEKKKEKL